MSLSPTTDTAGTNIVRLKRQLSEQAIAAATAAEWQEAVDINKRILELGADSEAENRLARALWELGELADAREHYQAALALDPTNRIAERNISRLRMLMAEAGKKTVPAKKGTKAPVSIFVEETGKTGFAHLFDLRRPQLAQVNPGDAVELLPDGPRARGPLQRRPHRLRRAARRRPPAEADRRGQQVRRRCDQPGRQGRPHHHPRDLPGPANYGKVSFPTAAKVSDLRPYTKGTLVREEMDLEEDLELDEEDEEIEDIGRVLPAEVTEDEAFVEEPEEPTRSSLAAGGASAAAARRR